MTPEPITVCITPKAAEEKGVPPRMTGFVKSISVKGAVLFTTGGREWWFAPSQIKQEHPDGSRTRITRTAAGQERPQPCKRAWVENERIRVKLFPFVEEQRALCARLGGWWDKDKKEWEFAKSLRTVLHLARHVPGLELDERLKAAMEKHKAKVALARRERALAMPPIPGIRTPERWFQRDAFYFLQSKGWVGELGIKMGYGKTLIALAAIHNSGALRTLVLCPKNVVAVWPREVAKHLGDGYRVLALNSKAGTVEERCAAMVQAILDQNRGVDPRPLIVVLNYQAAILPPLGPTFETYLDKDGKEKRRQIARGQLVDHPWDMKIFDESHNLIAPGGVTSILASKIRAPRAINMTGTPEAHGPLDWYGQARALREGLLDHRFEQFRAQYAIVDRSEGYPKILGYQNLDELNDRLARFVYQVEGEQLDLPPTRFEDFYAELGEQGRRYYRQMNREGAIEWGDDDEITAKNPLVKQLHLARLAGGWIVTDAGHKEKVDNGKLDALEELLDSVDPVEPVVLVYRFNTDLAGIKGVLQRKERPYLELNGKRDQWLDWVEGKAPILLLQIQAGNAGIDLTQNGDKPCGLMILYSVGFGLIDYMQLLKRVNRQGQTVPVTYARIITESTIDEYIYEVLQEKADLVEKHLLSINDAQHQIDQGAIRWVRDHAA